MLFGKIKGRAEKDLHSLSTTHPSLRTFAVRPGLIVQDDILRKRRPLEYAIQVVLGPIVRLVMPESVIGTKPLARVLVDLVLGDGNPLKLAPGVIAEGRTIRNSAIRNLAGI
jgi:hypothetical protein